MEGRGVEVWKRGGVEVGVEGRRGVEAWRCRGVGT